MMQSVEWILLDTETTGFAKPTFVVELGAQRMKGWEPVGEAFCELLNHGTNISEEAQRVHGYTQEILERDGSAPEEVYEAFRDYAADLPLVSYNSAYDLKQVLYPEWKRLGIDPIGTEGFCALELTQRLLDPVAAGNCKLQTLRQFYRLPQRGAHTAMGDVETVIDLMSDVLRPMAEKRGLDDWEDIMEFTAGPWYPAKLAFGKFKGRFYWEAEKDAGLLDWLTWLRESKKERSRKMGEWYLEQLNIHTDRQVDLFAHESSLEPEEGQDQTSAIEPGLIIYSDPEKTQLDSIIAGLRARMAELDAEYALETMKVDYARSKLFKRLRNLYEQRDLLRAQIEYRRKYIDALTKEGEEEAERVAEEFENRKQEQKQGYADVEKALEGKIEVSKEVQERVQKIFRKLSKIYHPDKHIDDPEKHETFQKLQQALNDARDRGDIDLLEEIDADPEGFARSQGWGSLDLSQDTDVEKLKDLATSLQSRIIETIEKLDDLKASLDYSLHMTLERDLKAFEELVEKQAGDLESSIDKLKAEADELGEEIEQLTGQPNMLSN